MLFKWYAATGKFFGACWCTDWPGRPAAYVAYQGLCVRVDERSGIRLKTGDRLQVNESSVTLQFTGAPFPDYQKMCEIVCNDKYRLSAILYHANADIQRRMQFFVNRCIVENNIEVLQLCAAHKNFKFTQESLVTALWFEKYQAAAIIVRAGMHIDSEVKKNLGYIYSLTDEQIADRLSKVQELLSGSYANTSAESVQSLQPEGNQA